MKYLRIDWHDVSDTGLQVRVSLWGAVRAYAILYHVTLLPCLHNRVQSSEFELPCWNNVGHIALQAQQSPRACSRASGSSII